MSGVLVDYHHSDLLESHYRLFEDRLGLRVYVPRGMEWFTEGIWLQGHEHFGDSIARQFLLAADRDELHPEREIHWVTLDEARAMDWTLVLASVPDNEPGYARFAAERGARYGLQVGNVNQWPDKSLKPLILDSTAVWGELTVTPEFDLEGAFRYRPPTGERIVSSFVNLFRFLECAYLEDEKEEAAHSRHPWQFYEYGHRNPDGFLKPTAILGDYMAESAFGWHDKVTGDGFGFVIHYWAAVGRPLIGHASHYRGQRAGYLWEDGVTAIDLDKHSPEETARLMEEIISDTPRHRAMCEEIAGRLRDHIDWPREAEAVRQALAMVPA